MCGVTRQCVLFLLRLHEDADRINWRVAFRAEPEVLRCGR